MTSSNSAFIPPIFFHEQKYQTLLAENPHDIEPALDIRLPYNSPEDAGYPAGPSYCLLALLCLIVIIISGVVYLAVEFGTGTSNV